MCKKLICTLLVISTQLCCLGVLAHASPASSDETISTCAVGCAVCFGDEYSTQVFSSLPEAKATFGYDFTYKSCAVFHNGAYYNYYYFLECGNKVFFYVDLDDGSGVWSTQNPDFAEE